ncbi:MAG: aminotransferase class V-fold PLP-dependent enzyme [Ignavibacteriae bacterium]|nr:aminotransferase class V-fold PLP-dependent enzyme [Ignavibacteriota bacterium]NOG99920.1 aminotransferase class V-fold PLP-dependent enzyme [Ignavibacteriota bacterium]
MNLEKYFEPYRKSIIGIDQKFDSPFGPQKIVYADWVASGRLYNPIENKLAETFGPFVGNTHSEASITGTSMTHAYHQAHHVIKKHVNAAKDDIIITAGFGMTTVVNKFQRILGIKLCEQLKPFTNIPKENIPVVFVTHMEHHSNQTSWLETICDVVVIEPDEKGLIDFNNFEKILDKYSDRKIKIGSFSACSNVTGIINPVHKMARMMHENGGLCFIDYAASAPYVEIDMHPDDPLEKLDAIFFSPHKFLGGPGTSGVLIFDSALYNRNIPDHPGGGTVDWTNPWGAHKYVNDIEAREDGGTPGFLQAIKTALAINLKEQMGVKNILKREEELTEIVFEELNKIPTLHVLAAEVEDRLGIISFYVEDIHYNLIVRILNDRYGIQVRGGCSCAGTYGHYLLHVDPTRSGRITEKISQGDLSEKPGWVRMSVHPTMTNEELLFILNGIKETVANAGKWIEDYNYSSRTNEFYHKLENGEQKKMINQWFEL